MNERIFISYKRVDKDRVFAIKDGIEQATRAKCWIDLDGIESNAQFAAKIMTAIDRCEVFLFMRSKEHNQITDLEKDWTYRELNYALSQEKNIVFINLDNSPIPNWVTFIFPHKQEVDSADPGKILRLHNDLKDWLGTAEEPTPQPKEEEKPAQIDEELLKEVWQEMTDEEIIIDNYTFKKDPEHFGLQLVKTDKTISNAIIPNTVPYNGTELPVTSIGNDAFHRCFSLTSVTIPNSVTRIGQGAFWGCSSLTSIAIPNSVTSISWSAFYGCSSLTSITIPNSVTMIQSNVFCRCSSLTSIIVEASNARYDSRNNCNAIINTAKNTLITGCRTTIIPNTVTTIGWGAFDGCSSLTSITIPNSVTSIEPYAFENCSSLISITIPNSVTSIREKAFDSCNSLQNIQFKGTKKQWKDIAKGEKWKENVPAKVIHCSDGNVRLGLFSWL